jgi:uncharacterized protein DUF11
VQSNKDTWILAGPDLSVTKTHEGMDRSKKPFVWTITIKNRGKKDTDGAIVVEDTLPEGVEADEKALDDVIGADCSVTGRIVRCELTAAVLPIKAPGAGVKDKDTTRVIKIPVTSVPKDGEVKNDVHVYGGGASEVTATDTIKKDEK